MMSRRASALMIAPPGRLRDGLRVLLRATGKVDRVDEADDARLGLQSIAARPPALVLLDAALGDDDAREVLQQLKTKWPQMLCIVLVHSLEQEHMAQSAGADAVLQAGFATEAFFSTIQGMLFDSDTI